MTSEGGHRLPWLRRLLPVAALLLLVQVFIALGALVYVTMADFERAIRVHASPSPLAGAATPLRVNVYERHSQRTVTGVAVEATLVREGEAEERILLEPIGVRGEILQGAMRLRGPAELRVRAEVAPGDHREILHALHPVEGVDPLADDRIWQAERTQRPAGARVGTADAPGLRWDGDARPDTEHPADPAGSDAPDSGSACAWHAHVTAEAGPPSRFVNNRHYMRFVTAEGEPVAGLRVSFERREVDAPDTFHRTTDGLGILMFDRRLEDAERWRVRWDCGGTAVRRDLLIVPSWSGIGLRRQQPFARDGDAIELIVEHQRAWGDWFGELFCDGRWVAGAAHPVQSEPRPIFIEAGRVGAPADAWRMCRVSAGTSMVRGETRGVWVPVLQRDTDPARIALALHDRIAAQPGAPTVLLRQPTRDALVSAPEADRLRYAGWLLSLPSSPGYRVPVLEDDLDASTAAFNARQTQTSNRLIALLVADVFLLVFGLLAFAIPALRQRRRALDAAMEDSAADAADDDEIFAPESLVDGRRAMLALVFAIGAILCFAMALGTLFAYIG